MENLYAVGKAFTDPVLIIFVLLTLALVFFLAGRKKKQ